MQEQTTCNHTRTNRKSSVFLNNNDKNRRAGRAMQHPLTWNFEILGNKLQDFLLVGGIEVFEKAHDCSSGRASLSLQQKLFPLLTDFSKDKYSTVFSQVQHIIIYLRKPDIFGWVDGTWYRIYYIGTFYGYTSMSGVKSLDPDTPFGIVGFFSSRTKLRTCRALQDRCVDVSTAYRHGWLVSKS